MIQAIKLFFGSPLGRAFLTFAAAGAVLGSAYVLGHSAGKLKGLDEGFRDGRAARQQEVDHLKDNVAVLTKTINDERKAVSDKVKQVEADATERAMQTQERLHSQLRARDQIIQNYERMTPVEVQQSCGLSIETVQAINQLIDKANGDSNESSTRGSTAVDSVPDGTKAEAGRTDGGRGAGPKDGDSQRPKEDAGAVPETPTA